MKDTSRHPNCRGVHIRVVDENQFDGSISQEARDELNLNLELNIIGDEALHKSEIGSQIKPKLNPLNPESSEVTYRKKRKRFIGYLNLKPNPLRYATRGKQRLYYLLIIATMLSEYVIYQSVANIAFGISEPKSYLVGFTAVLFTKFVAWSVSRFVKDWIKSFNIFRRYMQVIVALLICALIFVNAGTISYTNHKTNHSFSQLAKSERLMADIDAIKRSKSGEDTSELEAQFSELRKEINKPDSKVFILIKALAIMLVSILIIITGAILFVVAELYGDAIRLKERLAFLKAERERCIANHSQYSRSYDSLLMQRRELIRKYAKMEYLERLTTPFFQK